MKLIDLVPFVQSNKKVEDLYTREKLNIESEAVLVYMTDNLNLESELKFFDIEETDDRLHYESNRISYVQLFPLDYIIELTADLKIEGYSELEIAKRLLDYRIKDA